MLPGAGGHNVSDTENNRQELVSGHLQCESYWWSHSARYLLIAGQKSAHAPSRLFATAVNDVAKPWERRLRRQAPDTPPTEAPSTALTPEPAPQTEETEPVEVVEGAPKSSSTADRIWTAFPRKENITVGTPFSVGYACVEMGDKQPEGRAKDILLSRVWQQVKVNADAKDWYFGYEFPIVVFRARAVRTDVNNCSQRSPGSSTASRGPRWLGCTSRQRPNSQIFQ